MELTIKWEVDDGYAGKSRPHTTTFNTNDYMDDDEWNELSEDKKKQLIDDVVQRDFEETISFYIENYNLD